MGGVHQGAGGLTQTVDVHRAEDDVAAVAGIKAIPTILDIICRSTGMRFAAVARVTEDRWIACQVRDDLDFGLLPGGELEVSTTLCNEVRGGGEAIVIDSVADDPLYAQHRTPAMYGLQSYISVPIRLPDGTFFGTLCAIDSVPRHLKTPETLEMFSMFADVIALHLSLIERIGHAQSALQREQETAALREEFIAVLGHDLRNPLASIASGARLLAPEPLTERGKGIVSHIQGSVMRMSALIDNVLDFARGRLGGGITLQSEWVELEPVLRQVVSELRFGAPGRVIEVEGAVDGPILCDRTRIGQLVSNLLGNALTHGDPTSAVRLSASVDGPDVVLSVSNCGKPIPETAIARLFQPFFRGEIQGTQQGLGLGLHIASEIARAHGGSIDVASGPDETRFTVRIPAGRPPVAAQPIR